MKSGPLFQFNLPSGSRRHIHVYHKLRKQIYLVMQESQVDKNGLTFYKGFVLLPDTNSNHIQQLKLLLPTGHIYSVKNWIFRLFARNCVPFCYTKVVCDLIETLGCCASLLPVPILLSFPLRYFV
jgi:hypothetical protein